MKEEESHGIIRQRLAEKMAGEITLSEKPGEALKKWRLNFEIAQTDLSGYLGVSPSVISDYESGRRKSPGTAVVGKIVDSLFAIDEANGGSYLEKYSKMLFSNLDEDVIYDLHDFSDAVPMVEIVDLINGRLICGDADHSVVGYTVINSVNAILTLSPNEFNRIYGWSTERALIFTDVSSGKSPMVAIRVTPFKPPCVILQGIDHNMVHPLVKKLAERDRISVFSTEDSVKEIITKLRKQKW